MPTKDLALIITYQDYRQKNTSEAIAGQINCCCLSLEKSLAASALDSLALPISGVGSVLS